MRNIERDVTEAAVQAGGRISAIEYEISAAAPIGEPPADRPAWAWCALRRPGLEFIAAIENCLGREVSAVLIGTAGSGRLFQLSGMGRTAWLAESSWNDADGWHYRFRFESVGDLEQPGEPDAAELCCPVCDSPMHLIGTAPGGLALLRCLDHEAVPDPGHVDRYTDIENAPAHHFEYFMAETPTTLIRYGEGAVPGGSQHPEHRLWLLEQASRAFLEDPEDGDYLVLQSGSDWCHTVNYLFHDGVIEVEVNPRHWDPCEVCHNAPLPPASIRRLAELGFTGGQPGANFAADGLDPDPVLLARLAEDVFLTVYCERYDFAVGVRFRHGDVAETFLRNIVAVR